MKHNTIKPHLLAAALLFTGLASACTLKKEEPVALVMPGGSPVPVITVVEETPVSPAAAEETPALFITEVMTKDGDFVEIENRGSTPVNLGDYRIGDSGKAEEAVPLPSVILPAGQRTAVYGKNAEAEPKMDIALSRHGDCVYLFTQGGTVIDSVTVPALAKNTSWSRFETGWDYGAPTPGEENVSGGGTAVTGMPYTDNVPLLISEVLCSNSHSARDGYGSFSDFCEIYNPGSALVSLEGWYLSDREDNLAKWAFPAVTLNPGTYLAVRLSGQEESLENELHASFSLNGTETVYLYNGAEGLYVALQMPETVLTDVSVGPGGAYYRYPTPGRANGEPVYDPSLIRDFEPDGVYVSEVCSKKEGDWIELHNGSGRTVSLDGWQLSCGLDDTNAFTLSGSLEGGAYLVVDATSHASKQKNGVAAFGISLSGEKLYLTDGNGAVRDVFETGMLSDAASSGRLEDNPEAGRVFFTSSTKGKKNSASWYTGRAPEPAFSETGLYQTTAFELTISAPEGASIYYTTDGSEPTISSKQLYKNPLHIAKNTVVRAMTAMDGRLPSESVMCTYLFEEEHDIPVVSIALSPSDKKAVWSAKSKQSKTKVEREGYLSYYEADGRLGVEFPAGFKPKGAGTLGRAQASLSIHLRGVYGQSSVTYPFFEEYGWETFSSLVVRNSGQDYLKARMRDSVAARLCFGLNIDVSATHPCAVYVNGEYYGLYDFNEDQNADYLKTHYGVDPDTVEIIRFNQLTVKGSNANWKKIIDYARSKDFKSTSVYEEFIKKVDPDYFIDYLVCSMYLCNSDMANQKYWHTTDNTIRWRAIFYDFDYGMGFSRSAKKSIMSNFFSKDGTSTATSTIYTYIACALVKNPEWKQKFIERYVELIYTTFAPDRVDAVIDKLASEMENEMPRHIARWGSKNAPASMSAWRQEVESMRSWFHERPQYELKNVQDYFRLSDSYMEELRQKYSR